MLTLRGLSGIRATRVAGRSLAAQERLLAVVQPLVLAEKSQP
jgi:hypothetical protein